MILPHSALMLRCLVPSFFVGSLLPYLAEPSVGLLSVALALIVVRRRPALRAAALGLLIGGLTGSVALWSMLAERISEPETVDDVEVVVQRCWQGKWSSRCLVQPVDGRTQWYLHLPAGEHESVRPLARLLISARLEPWQHRPMPFASAFSYWLLRHRVTATGRATDWSIPASGPALTPGVLARWRAWLQTPDLSQPAEGVFRALLTGDRGHLTPTFRERVAQTQTQHLLALSGLHIGSLALWAYLGSGFLWRVRPVGCRLVWQRSIALLTAAGLLFTALPSVSLQRAFWMAVVPGALWLSRHRGASPRVLLLIAVAMVLADPLIWLDIGAWFSWWATLLLIMGMIIWQRWPVWARMLGVQVALGSLLMPIQAGWSLPLYAQGFWVNIVLVPWVTLVALPLAFLTALRVPFADSAFVGSVYVWDGVLSAATPPWAMLATMSPGAMLAFMLASAVLLLVRPAPRTVLLSMACAVGLLILSATTPIGPDELLIDYRTGSAGNLLVLRHQSGRVVAALPGVSGTSGGGLHRSVRREALRWPRTDWRAFILPENGADRLLVPARTQGVRPDQWIVPGNTDNTGVLSKAANCDNRQVTLGTYRVSLMLAESRQGGPECWAVLNGPGLPAPLLFTGGGSPLAAHRLGRSGRLPSVVLWPGVARNWRLRMRLQRYTELLHFPCNGGNHYFQRFRLSAGGLSCPQYGQGLLPWLRI